MAPELSKCIVLNPKHTPTFTAGDISLSFLRDCRNAATTYSRLNKVDPAELTESLFNCWQDFRVVELIELNRDEYSLLPFSDFLDKLCVYFLGPDWASKHRDTILDMRQREDEPFDQYSNALRNANSMLRGQPEMLEADALRAQIVATTIPPLKKLIQSKSTELSAVKDIQAWSNAVKVIDDDRCAHRAAILLEIEAENNRRRAATQGGRDASKRARTDASTSTSASAPLASSSSYNRAASSASGSGSGSTTRPPPITVPERGFLDNSFGCTKCRLPWVFHRANDNAPGCAFPSGIDYKPVTQASVNAARATLNVKALTAEQRTLLASKGTVAAVHAASVEEYFSDEESFETDEETNIGDRSI
ncbi:hypothetical protein C8F01DRAFT_1172829 [Mycena amicta]|nr:hypothetical protein C8F01DRAFT_1172829 [Mycena amicta]